jgi:hypothetical protein
MMVDVGQKEARRAAIQIDMRRIRSVRPVLEAHERANRATSSLNNLTKPDKT